MIVSNNVYANGKILKSGFISKSASVKEGINIKNPENKIIIIYNHGQNTNDKALKNECIWVNQIRNATIDANQLHSDALTITDWENAITRLKSQLEHARNH